MHVFAAVAWHTTAVNIGWWYVDISKPAMEITEFNYSFWNRAHVLLIHVSLLWGIDLRDFSGIVWIKYSARPDKNSVDINPLDFSMSFWFGMAYVTVQSFFAFWNNQRTPGAISDLLSSYVICY